MIEREYNDTLETSHFGELNKLVENDRRMKE